MSTEALPAAYVELLARKGFTSSTPVTVNPPDDHADDDDPLDEDDDEPNPYRDLAQLRGATSQLASWSRQLLDAALGVRIAVSVSDEAALDRELSSLRQLVHERPTIGRAAS